MNNNYVFSAKRKCHVNLSKHEHCLNCGIREYLPSSITWQTWRKRGRGGKERLLARVLSFVRSGHDSTTRNRWRNEANDSKLQSSDSQENTRNYAQSDCSEMVGFASPRSFEVILQTEPSKMLQYSIKREHANVIRRGAPRNITLCQAHFQLPLLPLLFLLNRTWVLPRY